MKFRRCTAANCQRPYQVNEFSANSPLSAHRGRITCPHCGRVEMGHGDSIFLTHALSREEEQQFDLSELKKTPAEKKQA